MSRETENVVLLLVGISIAVITVSGAFTRYVKPGLLPWLAASALLLIALALFAIIGDIRRGGPRHSDSGEAHAHRNGMVWLLVVPILVLIVAAPPALRPSGATPSATAVSNVALNRFPFAPLPPGDAPEVPLPEVLEREVQDSTGSLTNRAITVTGFVLNEAQGVDLGRVVIVCCAADARLARIHLRGPAAVHAAGLPDNTWLRVEGQVKLLAGQPNYRTVPTLEATKVTRIDTPANPYDYPH
ncbi:TIGR03943 family putative permease subunit [Mycobacterium heidelbergense]|uniref:TIGR03943 family putative permease subunit n=1 Tax=Mycobacterium heidelbergense TaxID=53376 RepID=UPI003CF1A910